MLKKVLNSTPQLNSCIFSREAGCGGAGDIIASDSPLNETESSRDGSVSMDSNLLEVRVDEDVANGNAEVTSVKQELHEEVEEIEVNGEAVEDEILDEDDGMTEEEEVPSPEL